MSAVRNWFSGKKTYFLVFAAVVGLVQPVIAGEMTVLQFIQGDSLIQLFGILGIGTVRAGIAKNSK